MMATAILSSCNNADVVVTGLHSKPTSASYLPSGSNPINASSYGGAVGTTGDGHIVKIREAPVAMDPTQATTPSGYHLTAKAAKW